MKGVKMYQFSTRKQSTGGKKWCEVYKKQM